MIKNLLTHSAKFGLTRTHENYILKTEPGLNGSIRTSADAARFCTSCCPLTSFKFTAMDRFPLANLSTSSTAPAVLFHKSKGSQIYQCVLCIINRFSFYKYHFPQEIRSNIIWKSYTIYADNISTEVG